MKMQPAHKSPSLIAMKGGTVPPLIAAAPDSPGSGTRKPGTSQGSSSSPMIWHEQQEKLLKQWGETASANRWMHYRTHLSYVNLTRWFTLPVIILSSLTGTMNFAQSSFPIEYHSIIPLIIGAVNLIMGIITTVGSFLRVSELAEGNRVAALSYGKLASNIRVEMLLPPSERTMGGTDFIALCRADMDRLSEQTPDIPRKIEKQFLAMFKEVIARGDTEFYTPELLRLRPVEIYIKKGVVTPLSASRTTDKPPPALPTSSHAVGAERSGPPTGFPSATPGPRKWQWPPVSLNAYDTKQTGPASTGNHVRTSDVEALESGDDPDRAIPFAPPSSLSYRDELATLQKSGHVSRTIFKSTDKLEAIYDTKVKSLKNANGTTTAVSDLANGVLEGIAGAAASTVIELTNDPDRFTLELGAESTRDTANTRDTSSAQSFFH